MSTPTTLSILPDTINIVVQQETDQDIEFQLTDGTNPVNITADTVKFTVRHAYGDVLAFPTKTNAPGQHSAPTQGKTRFSMTHDELSTITVASPERSTSAVNWVYEVRRIIAGTGDQLVYIQGQLTLAPVVGL